MLIFSHRGNLNGKNPSKENTSLYLSEAIANSFNVEFDINFSADKSRLILSHDEAEGTAFNNTDEFISRVEAPQFHALNIKNPLTVFEITDKLKKKNLQDIFFLFDFELVIKDYSSARFVMRSIQQQGINVAYRLSENENYFNEYLINDDVNILWMDEFEIPWITEHHISELVQRSKQAFYVSPDLHGEGNINLLKKRWDQMIRFGVSGICTDYPLELKKFIGK